jgi:uncharacterized protein (DUF924 family)
VTVDDVLAFWFQGDRNRFREDRWFTKVPEFDALCCDRFDFTVRAALDGALDPWAATPAGTLALAIVLDQLPRNIHRGSHLAFAGDAHARRVARSAVAGGVDAHLTPVERVFLYLPFEHSEDLADQDESVRLFATLSAEPRFSKALTSAERHRGVIRRFGRFPHRNAALGRISTPAEEAYLAEPGSGF